jgi:hypothetical protein
MQHTNSVTEDINLISKQTGIEDLIHVEKVYYKNNGSMSDTIMELMEYTHCTPNKEEKHDEFTNFRKIVEEKEAIFYKFVARTKDNMFAK